MNAIVKQLHDAPAAPGSDQAEADRVFTAEQARLKEIDDIWPVRAVAAAPLSKVTHTQGTWHVSGTGSVRCDPPHGDSIDQPESVLIACVYGDDPECKADARQAANARLIAASPALIEALEKMLDCFVDDPLSHQYSSGPVIEMARDAIALARPVEAEEVA